MTTITHINSGSVPVTYSQWVLTQNTFEEHDALWCHSFGIHVTLTRDSTEFESAYGMHTVAGKLSILLSTTTRKQADMLKLKYGPALHLVVEETVLPNTMSFCTLDRIVW